MLLANRLLVRTGPAGSAISVGLPRRNTLSTTTAFAICAGGMMGVPATNSSKADCLAGGYDVAKRPACRARRAAGKPVEALVSVQKFCQLTGLEGAEVSRVNHGPPFGRPPLTRTSALCRPQLS